jgi:signal peptidase II
MGRPAAGGLMRALKNPAGMAAIAAVLTFMLDQATKWWVYGPLDIAVNQPIRLAPFIDLVLVWNRGVSYGLLQQDNDLGRWLLTGGSVIAAIMLGVWAARTPSRFVALALGLIAGGALGNALDRVIYAAVLDFVHFHVGSFSWYVFNVADAAIVAGVIGLLYDSVFLERGRAARASGGKGEAASQSPQAPGQ